MAGWNLESVSHIQNVSESKIERWDRVLMRQIRGIALSLKRAFPIEIIGDRFQLPIRRHGLPDTLQWRRGDAKHCRTVVKYVGFVERGRPTYPEFRHHTTQATGSWRAGLKFGAPGAHLWVLGETFGRGKTRAEEVGGRKRGNARECVIPDSREEVAKA
ncbi:hypothetical protein K438DRAFT_1782107 [Mycena galopus ATCC 62051]|nr:hypothetical protein K438DRAFT_1782107 [Mycena galopus ATCC 62051]